jgi:hypothetical protein
VTLNDQSFTHIYICNCSDFLLHVKNDKALDTFCIKWPGFKVLILPSSVGSDRMIMTSELVRMWEETIMACCNVTIPAFAWRDQGK